jgi:hypothetical protein
MIVKGDHPDCAGMPKVFAQDQLPIRRSYLILHIAGDLAAGKLGRRLNGPSERHVGQLVTTENDHR